MYEWVTESVVLAENEHGSNIYCIASPDELIFVDAGMLHGYTSEFRKAMEKHYGLKASTLMITHAHIDHIMAMNVFSDCEIIAASDSRHRFDAHMATDFTDERLQQMERVFPHIREGVEHGGFLEPTNWVEGGLVVGDTSFKVEGGHSACSSSVHIGDEECIIIGDLVQSERPPYFGEQDTDMGAWTSALDRWAASEVELVLPGHGPVREKNYLSEVSEYFKDLMEALQKLKIEDTPEDEVSTNKTLPSGYWPSSEPKKPAHYYSIKRLYASLE